MLLMDSFYIFMGIDKIGTLEVAQVKINQFVEQFQDANYYGLHNAKMTIHLLIHVPSDVRRFGKLPNYWMFMSESLQGSLKSLIHGTTYNVIQRLCTVVIYIFSKYSIRRNLRIDEEEDDIPEGMIGTIVLKNPDPPSHANLILQGARCVYNERVYHSVIWRNGTSKNIFMKDSLNNFYKIMRFLKGNTEISSTVECKKLRITGRTYNKSFPEFTINETRYYYISMRLILSRIAYFQVGDKFYLLECEF